MATVVIMPRQGQSVESCIITAFNKKVGDSVEKGDILFSYETDKSSFDEPALMLSQRNTWMLKKKSTPTSYSIPIPIKG